MTTSSITYSFLIVSPILSQLPIPDSAWGIAKEFGFNAFLVVVLIVQNFHERSKITEQMARESQATREESVKLRHQMHLLCENVTVSTLAMNFLPEHLRETSKNIREESRKNLEP